ncbi:MAG: DMT family transporter [Chloroflexi bacterium]|nr:DMT family transporter [Chloroflexota bacterium]
MSSIFNLQGAWEQAQHTPSGTPQRTIRHAYTIQAASRLIPPPVFLLLSILSVQLGAAIAKNLFPILGSEGTVFVRISLAALIFMSTSRPRLHNYTRHDYLLVILFGITIAAMNSLFYASISRLPLGIAATLEFIGPFGVALAGSRRVSDLVWTAMAAAGIILLAPIGGNSLDPLGIVLALLAGGGWASYILLNARIGRVFPGGTGLALSMSVAAILLAPFSLTRVEPLAHAPVALLIGIGMAILSTVIPFSLELEALRRIPTRVFGVLMSLEPAIAALIGFVVLGETIGLRALIAIALIVIASSGVSFTGGHDNSSQT